MSSTLYEKLHNPNVKYTWNDKINILKGTKRMKGNNINAVIGIAEGMAFLHRSAILHRDLKTTNCLLNNPLDVKLTGLDLPLYW